ncbi:MAG: hypothetical protein U9R74_07635 [Pseudomonadota bacterium]|nr:hypothetical protein [Pseudomonadota bacterium]
MTVAKQLKDTVSGYRFVWHDNVYTVGVSIGLAMVSRHDLDTGEILKRADSDCYIAKDEGRNRIHAYEVDDELAQRHEGEMRWVNRIRIAMEGVCHLDSRTPAVPRHSRRKAGATRGAGQGTRSHRVKCRGAGIYLSRRDSCRLSPPASPVTCRKEFDSAWMTGPSRTTTTVSP